MLVHVVADYGPGDLAFTEVAQRLKLLLPDAEPLYAPVPAFATLATGEQRLDPGGRHRDALGGAVLARRQRLGGVRSPGHRRPGGDLFLNTRYVARRQT